ncbi:hypothetical protein FKR81_42625 [Lentzea tibetensis]|uniref:Uncharacterized protein n=1 Tax=Lentzea tibetensis TaxID=2591470 RepID=A0A563EEF4_9PSEU|nr:M48 family metallopeptidase [Lentzea tibetensis]TWP43326.1 hypothetical protein FKR81_42625 [Lentzea tibetensis]
MRAVLALGTLAAFFAVTGVFSLGMTVAAVWLCIQGLYFAGLWAGVFAFAFGASTLWSAWVVFRHQPEPEPHAVLLTREAQPELWQLVDEVAAVAGTRGVEEIRLVLDGGSGVEQRRGLRWLELGLPVVAGLNVSELRALLASQFSYLDGGGSRLAALAYRAKLRLDGVAGLEGFSYTGTRAFASVYARVAAPIADDRERHANERATAAGSPGITQRTAHALPSVLRLWSDFRDTFLLLAEQAGRTPPVLAGFLAYLDHPSRNGGPCDSCEALAREDGVPRDERLVWMVLNGAENAAQQLLPPRPFAEWQEIVELAGPVHTHRYAVALEHAGRVSGIGSSLGNVLDALTRGELRRLTGETVDLSLSREEADRAAVETVTELLAFTVVHRLVMAGQVKLELDWGGVFALRVPQGGVVHPEELVAPAVRDPALVPQLRAHLQVMGVDGL